MKYRVIGADRLTGEDVELVLDAIDAQAAEEKAQSRGLVVAEVIHTSVESIGVSQGGTSNAMALQRKAVLLASAIGASATFMPWVKAPIIGSVSGAKGDGWITFALFLVCLVLSLSGDKSARVLGVARGISISLAAIAGSVAIWKIFDFKQSMSELRTQEGALTDLFAASVQIGIGLYAVVGAAFAVCLLAFWIKK